MTNSFLAATNAVQAAAQAAARAEAPAGGTYLGEDGLRCCAVCRMPVQYRVKLLGQERVVPCVCRCTLERRAAEKAALREADRARMLQRLRADGMEATALRNWRFETAEDCKLLRIARRYVAQWEKVSREGIGLMLWGSVGTGKTFAAACIANALLDQGIAVRMTNFSHIMAQMSGLYTVDRVHFLTALAEAPLLILDDLGMERNTEYALEQVYAVVDERYRSGRPLIVTTNLTISEIRAAEDVAHARIYSRILEMCTPINVSGPDRRAALGQAKQNETKKILLGAS